MAAVRRSWVWWGLAVLGLALWYLFFRRAAPLAQWLTSGCCYDDAQSGLSLFAGWMSYRVIGLEQGTPLGTAAQFFFYEAPKILVLLAVIVFGMGVVRTFFPPERARQILAGRRLAAGNVLAGLLGVVTPFCSCSAVPLFIGFVTAGVPLGVTLSFLIAAPMVNEVALVLLFGLFGWQVAALYLATGLTVAIAAGWVIGRLKLERYVEAWVYQTGAAAGLTPERLRWGDRLRAGREAVRDILGKVWPYVLLGIAVGAWIHGYVPEAFLASVLGKGSWWSVPLAVVLGVPMYANAAGMIPVVQALLEKGATLGAALAFLMSVTALSLPEAVILRRVLKWRLILLFFGIVAGGIIGLGYLFNAIL